MKNSIKIFCLSAVVSMQFLASCTNNVDSNEPLPLPPVGGYDNSDDIAKSNLIVKFGFEDNINDSFNGVTGGVATNITYVEGIKGKAYQGTATTFAGYSAVNAKLSGLKSITNSVWIKTSAGSGAQCLFMLPRTSDFFGNIFVLIDGSSNGNMNLKVHIQKTGADWSGQWMEHVGANALVNMYGDWKHLVWTYDSTTSKYKTYVNGEKLNLPDGFTNRFASDPANGGLPLGGLVNSDVSKFIIGGFQQHLGAPWGTPESWMVPYTGLMDELRIYDIALTDSEVRFLYKLEKTNR
jgi:Concanavalin A-like lectin/glucanases superfamily